MSIRFKFRSSVNYDSVDIDGRHSVSVHDLRSKIVRHKNLKLYQDFDLVFSDALTGQEYGDDNFHILSGSNVIIKRVPAGTALSALAPVDAVVDFGMKDSNLFNAMSGMDDFDDFGVELCPVREATLPDSDIEFGKNCMRNERENTAGSRMGCQKLEASDLSEAVPRVSVANHNRTEGTVPWEPKLEEKMKLEEYKGMVDANSFAVQKVDLPSELKCSLCNTFFKEAVMIPCCQHSFCDKCIRLVLIEKAKCPKCSSIKCRVDDLLPNLSLRQAIEHFLESQMLITGSDSALHKYAPVEESGIQDKDVSCAVNIVRREPELPHSPSATEKGSNQIISESVYKSLIRENKSSGGAGYHLSNLGAGGDRSFVDTGRYKKGDRSCYMCGSTDHFIRDCPFDASQHPMLQSGNVMFPGAMPGYASPYWNGTAFPPVRPFTNMYGNPGMMPFNATVVPVTPYAVTSYIPFIYGGLPAPGGYVMTGVRGPSVGKGAKRPLSYS